MIADRFGAPARRWVRAVSMILLALALIADVWNAVTVRGRAVEAVVGSEAERAPLYQLASWCAAAFCGAVLLGVLLRGRRVARTPQPLLWIAGLAGVLGSFVVQMGTASMWV
jgi:cytochrome bd-type quinol oxidase subunit 2